jgi:hypothetical protein
MPDITSVVALLDQKFLIFFMMQIKLIRRSARLQVAFRNGLYLNVDEVLACRWVEGKPLFDCPWLLVQRIHSNTARRIVWLAKELLASQDGLCLMELVSLQSDRMPLSGWTVPHGVSQFTKWQDAVDWKS